MDELTKRIDPKISTHVDICMLIVVKLVTAWHHQVAKDIHGFSSYNNYLLVRDKSGIYQNIQYNQNASVLATD